MIATFRLLTASLLQAIGSTGCGTALCMAVVCCDWRVSIRLLFLCTVFSLGVRWLAAHRWFSCFFDCRHPRFRYFGSVALLMLFGLSLMWIASFTFLVYQWLSLSINFTSSDSDLCPVSVFWDGGTLGACETYISVVFFHSFLHGSSCFTDCRIEGNRLQQTETLRSISVATDLLCQIVNTRAICESIKSPNFPH